MKQIFDSLFTLADMEIRSIMFRSPPELILILGSNTKWSNIYTHADTSKCSANFGMLKTAFNFCYDYLTIFLKNYIEKLRGHFFDEILSKNTQRHYIQVSKTISELQNCL